MERGDRLFDNSSPPNKFTSPPKILSFISSDCEEANCLLEDECSDDGDEIGVKIQKFSTSKESVTYLIEKYHFNSLNSSDKLFTIRDDYTKESYFKCPICLKNQKQFFCSNCICNGDFTHSKKNFLERFADKKLKFIKFKSQQMQTSSAVQKHFCNVILKDELVKYYKL